MLFSAITILAAAAAVGAQSIPAPLVSNNPYNAGYSAVVKPKASNNVAATIQGTSMPDGKGVKFAIAFNELPVAEGPFTYHIHAKPVPTDGNCTGTGAHLDPYNRGETPVCDASKPETCQTGDLAGKHGKVTTAQFSTEYVDMYLATNPQDPSYFGNLSFVIHLPNKTRIACANFTMINAGVALPPASEGAGYPVPSPSAGFPMASDLPQSNTTSVLPSATTGRPMSPSSATASLPAQFTGAATKVAGGAGALLAAAVALVL
ncbi:superoxide dismutase [Pyrenophora seminiperda CCB06]|uniref:superoxide dismutase n=1 Tax=Pyrenophora seminiperda CCB06 TaxID=1302712 RepID=A0A3M7M3H0_9PLEO|nr:superoxide dismutase [Pyrenophora seminiperda CCB06]